MLTISNRQHIAMKQVFEQVANCAKCFFFFLHSSGTLEWNILKAMWLDGSPTGIEITLGLDYWTAVRVGVKAQPVVGRLGGRTKTSDQVS